jgi:CubicO group peptidase (beta-lactamase class C family)
MRIGLFVAMALSSAIAFSPTPSRADDAALTGVALQVDRGADKPILAIYAGDNGLSDKKPMGPDTLFDIGSNTKEFTSALILKLEAAGKLNIDDTIGKWLPQYPAWKDVTIRSLLQMTSPIPNYSETVAIGEIEVADLHHQFSSKDLIGFVDLANGAHGEDKFGPSVIGDAFTALQQAGLPDSAIKPAAK